MKKFVCTVCGYIYEGAEAPAECPLCHAPKEKFKEQTGDAAFVCEHEIGVGAKDKVEQDVYEGLLANFNGTKKNLQLRADAEAGACAGKFELAKRAKQLNYDAIHDTVHEMAKDEARHGAGFAGLLKRYF